MLTAAERRALYLAVWGASVAAQVVERFRSGVGAPDDEAMDGIVQEADAVAEMAVEAEERRLACVEAETERGR